MGNVLSTYEVTILVDVLLDAGTRRYATRDFYDGSDNYYKGTLLDEPQISRQLSDLYYGVEQSTSITLRFSNIDNGIDDTWDDIVVTNADEPRGRWITIQRHDPVDGTTFEFRGRITSCSLGPTVEITLEMRDDDILETLLPQGIVTTDEFTVTALDLGEAINLCFGHCRNVPLRNIQNKMSALPLPTTTATTADKLVDAGASFLTSTETNEYVHRVVEGVITVAKITNVDSDTTLSVDNDIFVSGDSYSIHAHDYLIGYGTIESLWVDHANDLGVRRNNTLVTASEYDFLDGSQGSPFNGYAFIRFAVEQMDFGGQMMNLTADVKGLEMGGATAERNFADAIKNFLSDATWGLGDNIDAASFTAAANDLDTIGNMYCDGSVNEQRKARDVLDELMFPARARIWRAADGEWEIHIDQTGASVLDVGDNDGFYNNAEVISTFSTPTSEALRHVVVHYSLDPSNDDIPFKEVDVAVHTGFGVTRTYELPFVMEDATAAHVLNYLKNRSIYSDDRTSLRVGMEGRDLAVGEIVTVTAPERNLTSKDYIIEGISKSLTDFELTCREYNAAIYGTFAVTPPTGPTGRNYVVYGPETWVGPIMLGDGQTQSAQITMTVADGYGDIYIAAGKTDFTTADNGFILGIDDSDANKVKLYLGDATNYFYWDASKVMLAGDGGNLVLDTSVPSFALGAATDYMTGIGIWMGKHGGVYKEHIGNPAADNLHWDGSDLYVTGMFIGSTDISGTVSNTWEINNDNDDVNVQLIFGRTTGGDATMQWNGTTVSLDKSLTLSTIAAGAADYDKFLVSHTGLVKYRTGAQVLADLSGDAAAAFSFNSQNLTGVGTIGCGTITTIGDYLLANGNYIGISGAERLEFYTAGYAAFIGCNVGIGTTGPFYGRLQVGVMPRPFVVSTGNGAVIIGPNDFTAGVRQAALAIVDEVDSYAAGVGGGLLFGGKYHSSYTLLGAGIKGIRPTGNSGDDSMELGFYTSYDNNVLNEVVRIDKNGSLDIIQHNAATVGLKLGGVLLVVSAADVNILDGCATGNLVLNPAGDILLNPTGNDVYPSNNYDINLGLINKKFLTLHAAELWVETLVAHDTMATIGGRILVGPTTMLAADLGDGAGDTTITVEHNNLANGDTVVLQANAKLEFMKVTSAAGGGGPYTYTVIRDRDGTGRNVWYAGDAVFNTGAANDGFIDLYSLAGVVAGATAGPTIVGNIRNSDTYNDFTECWAIGNLNGIYGYGADTYGAAFGKYSAADYMTIDPTNGIRFLDSGDVLRAQLTSGEWTLGFTTNEHIKITATAIQFKDGATVYTELSGGTLILGNIAAEHVRITGTGVELKDAANVYGVFAATTTLGDTGNEHVEITSAHVQFKDGGSVYTDLTAGVLTLGLQAGGEYVTIASTGMQMFGNAAQRVEIASDGTGWLGTSAGITWDAAGNITVAGTITVGSFANLPDDENLVGYWALDDGSGTVAVDGSGNDNGTIVGSPTVIDGVVGKALNFDGANKVTLDTPIGTAATWTISLWYKRTGDGAATYRSLIADKTANIHHLQIRSPGTTTLSVWDGSGHNFSYSIPDDGEFHHYVVVYVSGDTADLYVDGVWDSQVNHSIDLSVNKFGSIGNWNGNNYYAGPMDEIRIYDRGLILSEIKALYLYPAGNKGTRISGNQIRTGMIQSNDWAAAAGSAFDLNNKWIKMGGSNVTAAGAAAGIFLGLDTSYKAYIGDGTNQYFKFDGTNISWKGTNTELDASGNLVCTSGNIGGFYIGANDLWGGNAAIGNEATTIVLGNLDGVSKIALGVSADTIVLSTEFLGLCNFDSGGLTEPAVGDTFTGNTSGATARITSITVSIGAWGDGDAVGTIELDICEGRFHDNETVTTTTGGADTLTINMPDSAAGVGLVQNGDFSVGTDPPPGWTASNATLTTEAGGGVGNCMKVLDGGAGTGYAYQSITTVVGRLYTFLGWAKDIDTGNNGQIKIGTAADNADYYDSGAITDDAGDTYEETFEATTTTTVITVKCTTAAGAYYFDEISLYGGAQSGFIADGGGNLRVGDADSWLKWSGGALDIQLASGEAITLAAGGDIILTPSDANPAFIKWATRNINLGCAANAGRGLCFWPDTANSEIMRIGYDAVNDTYSRFDAVYIYSQLQLTLNSYYDVDHSSTITLYSSNTQGYISFYAEKGGNTAHVQLQGGATKRFTPAINDDVSLGWTTHKWKQGWFSDYVIAMGGIHVGGTADPGTDNLVVDGLVNIGLAWATGAGLTTKVDRSSGYCARFWNDGNNADRYGMRIQCGDDAGTVCNILYADDGDGTNHGYLMIDNTVFKLVDVSDRAIKRKIQDMSFSGLEKINAVKVRQFEHVDLPDVKRIGFIAQELEEIYPEAVINEEGGLKGVCSADLIPLLTKAIQELEERLKLLES